MVAACRAELRISAVASLAATMLSTNLQRKAFYRWPPRRRRICSDKIEPGCGREAADLLPLRAAFIRSSLPAEMAMPNPDLIRASEIADWCFCRRSWYLSARGVGPNLVQIEKWHVGVDYHQEVFVYQPDRALNETCRRFCWTNRAVSATLGLDETNGAARREQADRYGRFCS